MKGVANLILTGLIGTVTIVYSILIPPTIIKSTIDKETIFTYKFENLQSALLSVFSAEKGNEILYESLGLGIINKDEKALDNVDKKIKILLDDDYCLATFENSPSPITSYAITVPASPLTANKILGKDCANFDVKFNTFFVLPYNHEDLVKIVRIGVR